MKKFWFLFYNLFIVPVLYLGVRIVGLYNNKVKRGIKGRRRIFEELIVNAAAIQKSNKLIWFHSSSLGEFEQAKPIIEELVNSGNITVTSSESDGSFLDEKSLVEVDTTDDVTKVMPILFANPNVNEVTLTRDIQYTNGYGQTTMGPAVNITMSRNTYNKINWSQWNDTPDLYYQDIYNDADSYYINPVIYNKLPSDVVLDQSKGT